MYSLHHMWAFAKTNKIKYSRLILEYVYNEGVKWGYVTPEMEKEYKSLMGLKYKYYGGARYEPISM